MPAKYDFLSRKGRKITTCVMLATMALLSALIFRVQAPRADRHGAAETPFLQIIELKDSPSTGVHIEQAELYDTAPLFLPTHRNASANFKTPPSPESPPQPFGLYDSILVTTRDSVRHPSESSAPVVAGIDYFLAENDFTPMRTFGTEPVQVGKLAQRDGILTASDAISGRVVASRTFSAPTVAHIADGSNWAPCSYLVLVRDGRVSGIPLLESSSELRDLDDAFRSIVGESMPWAALPSGYYRIRIAP